MCIQYIKYYTVVLSTGTYLKDVGKDNHNSELL